MKPSKLFNWIWSKKTETVEVPQWTSREENERKYEDRHKRERALFLKMQEKNKRNSKIPKSVID